MLRGVWFIFCEVILDNGFDFLKDEVKGFRLFKGLIKLEDFFIFFVFFLVWVFFLFVFISVI